MDYEQFKLKSYKFWELFMHKDQSPYIGRCYANAKRKTANTIGDMAKEERDELFDLIFPQWESAIKSLFAHTRANIAALGNTYNHLNWHMIPRYKEPREFLGMQFIDPDPTRNYSPYPKNNIPLEVLMQIKDSIKSKL